MIFGTIIKLWIKKLCTAFLFGTIITDTIELDLMTKDSVGCSFIHYPVQGLINWYFQVRNPVTSLTNEVVVRLGVGIESVKSAAKVYSPSQSLLDEDIEISVNSSHTEVGELIFQLIVEPGCGRVSPRTPQYFERSLSLPAALIIALRVDPNLLLIIIIGTILNLTNFFGIVNRI
jgi:hypothetical protein